MVEETGRARLSKIFWDTMVFIYLLENHPSYAQRVQHISERMVERGDRLFTSTLAAGEVLTGPQRTGDLPEFSKLEQYFQGPAITLLPFTFEAARHYSSIRAQHSVAPPDAIHLACAATEGVDVFITNDKSLVGKSVAGIQFIVGLDTNLF
jgi:predicted nucleic acid-binding protein